MRIDANAKILAALAAIESRLREGFSPRSAHPALDALVSRVSREVRAIDPGETTDDVNRLVFSLASFLFDRIRVQRQTDPTVAYLFKTEPPLPVEADWRWICGVSWWLTRPTGLLIARSETAPEDVSMCWCAIQATSSRLSASAIGRTGPITPICLLSMRRRRAPTQARRLHSRLNHLGPNEKAWRSAPSGRSSSRRSCGYAPTDRGHVDRAVVSIVVRAGDPRRRSSGLYPTPSWRSPARHEYSAGVALTGTRSSPGATSGSLVRRSRQRARSASIHGTS